MRFGVLRVSLGGQSIEFPLDLPTITIGSGAGNTVRIDDPSVAARHARITIESGRMLVEDLGSAGGTYVGGQPVAAGAPNLVEGGQSLRFGNVEANYEPPAATPAPGQQAAAALPPADLEQPSTLRASVTSPGAAVQAGETVFVTLTAQNRGRVVDQVTISIPDLPAEWVTFARPALSLLPNQEEDVAIVIQVPHAAEAHAGDYPFTVVVRSAQNGSEAAAVGKFTVLRYEATTFRLDPIQGTGDFTVIARNDGNGLATYTLSGTDDEEAFTYEFDDPLVSLQPGQEQVVRLKVGSGQRRLVGQDQVLPFKVIAEPTAGGGERQTLDGMLMQRTKIKNVRKPLAIAAVGALIAAAVLVFLFWPRDKETKVGPEDAYAGVHMCGDENKDARAAATAKAKAAPKAGAGAVSGSPVAGETGGPYFAQNNPLWGREEYAKANDAEFGPDWCGRTIEQCGCAMTSVATIMAIFELVTLPDGQQLSPKTLNDWFNEDANKTRRGWVSRGYAYGDVVWSAAGALSAQMKAKDPKARTIRFVRAGSGSESEIRSELAANRPIILEVPGHWIAAVGLEGDKILINDPYYRDRKYLDVYAGRVKSSIIFEPSDDLSALVITVPSTQRVRVTDAQGRVVGTLTSGTPQQTQQAAQKGIEGSSYMFREAWRDPDCVESPPPPGAGTIQIIIPRPANGTYKIETLDTNGKVVNTAVHIYDKKGKETVQTVNEAVFNLEIAGEAPPSVTPVVGVTVTPEPPPGVTATVPPIAPPVGGVTPIPGQTSQPPAGPSVLVTVVGGETVVPPPPTVITAPDAIALDCPVAYSFAPKLATVSCSATVTGTFQTTSWKLNGAPTGKTGTTYSTQFTSNTVVIITFTACNQGQCKDAVKTVNVNFTPTPVSPGPSPSATVVSGGPPNPFVIQCTYTVLNPEQARIDCSTTFTEKYNTITWNSPLASPTTSGPVASKTYSTFKTGAGTVNVAAQACYLSVCVDSNTVVVGIPGTVSNVALTVQEDDGPQYVNLVAQVVPGTGGGTVTFYQMFGSTSVTLGTIAINASGVAVYTGLPGLAPGQTYQFRANYSGSVIVAPGQSVVVTYFVRVDPTVTLGITCNPDNTTRISVTVAGPSGTPSGSVALTYLDSSFIPLGTVGTVALTNGSGLFSPWTPPPMWSGYIRASYPGDALFTSGSDTRSWSAFDCI